MINLKLDRNTDLSFKLNIEGSEDLPISRFILKLTEDFDLILHGKIVDKKYVKVNIPPLAQFKEIFSWETVKCFLEVVIDNSIFVPWESDAQIIRPLLVRAEEVEVETNEEIVEEKKPTVSLTLETVSIEKDSVKFEDFSDLSKNSDRDLDESYDFEIENFLNSGDE